MARELSKSKKRNSQSVRSEQAKLSHIQNSYENSEKDPKQNA